MRGVKRLCALALAACLVCIGLGGCLLREPAQLAGSRRGPSSSRESAEGPADNSEPEDPDFPVSAGGQLIEEKLERVVSLNPSITEILCDMGLAAALCGIGQWEGAPDVLKGLPRCGSELLPDIPAILQAQAQAVLAIGQLPESAQEALSGKGVLLLRFEKPEAVEGLPDYYGQLASALLGRESGPAAAAAFSAPLLARFEAILAAAQDLPERPLGAFAAFLPLTLATGDCLQGRLLEQCGIENAAAEYAGWQYPQELLIPFEPQVLVVDTRTVSVEEAAAHPNYRTTPCAVNGRILGIDGGAIENGGARLFEAAEQIARLAGAELPEAGRDPPDEGQAAGHVQEGEG